MGKFICENCYNVPVAKYGDICPLCLNDLFNDIDRYRDESNKIITEFVDAYSNGQYNFMPTLAEDIKRACNTLQEISDDPDDAQMQNICLLLNIKKGIRYAKVVPLLIEFQAKVNSIIDKNKSLTATVGKPIHFDDALIPF